MAVLHLSRLDPSHADLLLEMAGEFRAEGDPRFDPLLNDAEAFFASVERFARGQDLPSIRVIEKNGGRPAGTSVSPNTGERMLRYWIDLRP